MTNLLLRGCSLSENKGSAAILVSTIESIRRAMPNTEFTLVSPFPETDRVEAVEHRLRVVNGRSSFSKSLRRFALSGFWLVLSKIGADPARWIHDNILREYDASDMVLDLSGDAFSDDYGKAAPAMFALSILQVLMMRKVVVLYAQSIGPFDSVMSRLVSKLVLRRVRLIILREDISLKHLKGIGIEENLRLTADPAFLLEPSSDDRVSHILKKEEVPSDEHPIVGLSVSQHMYEFKKISNENSSQYVSLMSAVADYVTEKMGGKVILVPHVTSIRNLIDDRTIGFEIQKLAGNSGGLFQIRGDYSSSDLKGIISKCDVFVGSRMHANIAALSSFVPTLALSYSHKSKGIMRMAGMDDFVLDYRLASYDEITQRIQELWRKRMEISLGLESTVADIRTKAQVSAHLIRSLAESLQNRKS